ncbi:zincin-like metallopeptidase domain-containing protein [Oceaniglobus indicus]|uniref:zincin-like metallopeptidase domain-containing protein n=1 Tax=Oceaniglobus indicus TaxID=2047749 RepID=UPI003B980E17
MPLEVYLRGEVWYVRGRVDYDGRSITEYYRESTGALTEQAAREWCAKETDRQRRRHLIGPEADKLTVNDAILAYDATRADIRHGGNSAHYSGGSDHVQMPAFETFRSAEAYYATLAHELTHWTKHKSRLDRDLGRKRWGDEGYAREELVAELGAAFLCADLELTPEPRSDHAAYIQSWLKVLKEDKRAIFTAAAHAQRAADFLHGLQPMIEDEQPRAEEGVAA